MNIKHKKCLYFVNGGLFAHLTKFEDLEARIAALPQEERGNAFEVFAQGYLATQGIAQAAQVWPFDEVPQHVRAALGLGARDMGVDGVILTNQGSYQAYQVKYRSGRESLTWQEVSTFMGLSDRVATRILFTNSNELSSVLDDRTGFYAITGTDLDRLNEQDFYAIEQWFKDSPVVVFKASPRPHQKEALEAIGRSLKEHDRVTAVMACGTGKTLLALWLAEQQDAQSVLVLLPSLSLVRQTLHAWVKETKWEDYLYLCICSDKTVVANDEIVVKQIDCDFPVTTDVVKIQKFLEHSKQRKIVFSTYQSSMLIPQNFVFDIAIFDEAHKTAGREGTKFAYALKDENIAIKKRVFLTATPRHYDILKKDKEGDARLVFSMDDQEIYGPICYRLSFAEAAKREIICNYKVIISVVISDSLNRGLLQRGEVDVQGDAVKAHRIANILALTNAIERYNIKRIFTFHNSVKVAQSFTSDTSEGVTSFVKDFNTFHINGDMSTSKRELVMRNFKNSPKAIMSNARCLTEGVDVPTVDMVAFISPKKSRVDIVQAAGRAMRKSTDKECGYIFIPIFLEIIKDETIEQALEKTQYDDIWQVLQALQEHDESLVEIIGQMRQEIGRTGSCNDSRLLEKVEVLAPEVCLTKLRDAIETRIVYALSSFWDERFGELVKYKEQYGHCIVPEGYLENPALATWVSRQRQNYKKKLLTPIYIDKLNKIGFDWDPFKTAWEYMFAALCKFKKENGHCNVPCDYQKDPLLGRWVSKQRRNFKKKKLAKEYVDRLNNIGFKWDILSTRWDRMFAVLCEFKHKNGHCNVPDSYPENPSLAIWVQTQRTNYKNGDLSKDRVENLNDIGFIWDHLAIAWEAMFIELCEYKQKNGHCNIRRTKPDKSPLAKWVSRQRQIYKRKQLSQECVDKLNKIGFEWVPIAAAWQSMYMALCDFKKEFGHCNVPRENPKHPKLAVWVNNQRQKYKKENLSQECIDKLNKIGFEWDPIAATWNRMYSALSEFKKEHGHCNIPCKYPKNPSLAKWVSHQRQNYKNGDLSKDRVENLNELGFNWDPLAAAWESNFKALCDFKKEGGHCNVPARYDKNPLLSSWVTNQRKNYKDKQLIQEDIDRLNELGFIWDPLAAAWEEMYSFLCEFNKKHGHCNVPEGYPENPSLATWVYRQRKKIKQLAQLRIDKLNEIGFDWDPLATAWMKMYKALCEFKKENGHCKVPEGYSHNRQLATWVSHLRESYKKKNLSQERIDRLNRLGFCWTIKKLGKT